MGYQDADGCRVSEDRFGEWFGRQRRKSCSVITEFWDQCDAELLGESPSDPSIQVPYELAVEA